MAEAKPIKPIKRVRKVSAPQAKRKSKRFKKGASIRDIMKGLQVPEVKFTKFKPGNLYSYNYLAFHRDELPYWDKHPLIIWLQNVPRTPNDNGQSFYGLNLHYVPLKVREKIFKQFKFKNGGKEVRTASAFTAIAEVGRYYPAMIHMYLYKQIKNKPTAYETSAVTIANISKFPTAEFVGASPAQIYADSMAKRGSKSASKKKSIPKKKKRR